VLKKAFDAFDREKQGHISTDMIGTIFEMLGIQVSDEEMEEIIEEVDSDGEKKIQKRKLINE
jgi:calmodulin